jgi:hypothetical protein
VLFLCKSFHPFNSTQLRWVILMTVHVLASELTAQTLFDFVDSKNDICVCPQHSPRVVWEFVHGCDGARVVTPLFYFSRRHSSLLNVMK